MTDVPHFLLDCDPGIDDAFAIFCALKYGHIDVVTTVSGNVAIDNTTKNALHILDLAGVDIPVHRGADRPLRIDPVTASEIHGESGLGNYVVAEPRRTIEDTTAVEAILAYCAAGDAVIVATGPLTNIALALEADPTLADRVAHLYWMGGGTTIGNVTEFAEFNAWCDPDAVAVTMDSGIALTMFDLDLTHQVRMGDDEVDRLRTAGTMGNFFADALEFYRLSSADPTQAKPMHDPCAVLGFLRPDHFTFRSSNIVCNDTIGEQRGRTLVRFDEEHLPHRVAVSADVKEVIELILMAIIDPGGAQ